MRKTVVLIILDGWGIGAADESNPIYAAHPANFRWLADTYPLASLQASGIGVGLPWGEVGNSEVGHLTLGAGKVVYQYYPKITLAIQDQSFFANPALRGACDHAKAHTGVIHFAGLLSKANVHAALDHLLALIALAEREGVPQIKLHLFTDGKDSPPGTVYEFLESVPRAYLKTLIGRHYAMDRSENWSLIGRAYECLLGKTPLVTDPQASFNLLRTKNMSEEFLPPSRLAEDAAIKDGDALVFFNFREDSILELARVFAEPGFNKFPIVPLPNLHVATLTHYGAVLSCPVAFPADTVERPLGQILAEAGKSQLRIAETYKHAHVTFFFNGHREEPFPGEHRALIPSLSTAHPDEHPELMAAAVTDRLLEAIQGQAFDFVLANYSNPDTIAHTGNYDACLKAVQVVDEQIGRILKVALTTPTTIIITSDHGNMEEVLSPVTGQIETQHDANPVPLHLIGPDFKGKRFFNADNLRVETTGILADVAPTVLDLLDIPPPPEMTGRSLLQSLS